MARAQLCAGREDVMLCESLPHLKPHNGKGSYGRAATLTLRRASQRDESRGSLDNARTPTTQAPRPRRCAYSHALGTLVV